MSLTGSSFQAILICGDAVREVGKIIRCANAGIDRSLQKIPCLFLESDIAIGMLDQLPCGMAPSLVSRPATHGNNLFQLLEIGGVE